MNRGQRLFSIEIPRALGLRLVFIGILLFCLTVVSYAQVSPITASGLSTNVSIPVDIGNGVTKFDITGGIRPEGGQNLFHSFGKFNVPENNIANFLNDSELPTSNILSRVTGGNPSSIFGTIQTTGFAGASVFLLNPNGVIFGPNATLDVKGGFYASTADFIQLGQNDIFHANLNGEESVLTMAPPEAFGFLGDASSVIGEGGSAAILVEGLDVPLGESVSLVGRDAMSGNSMVPGVGITEGIVRSPGGRVKIASIGDSQAPELNRVLVGIDTLSIQGLDSQRQILQDSVSLGEITLSKRASVDASGAKGGTVRIVGGQLLLDASGISTNTTSLGEGQLNVEPGLGIDIQVADKLFLNNGSFLETVVFSNVPEDIETGGINLQADHVEIANDSIINSEVLPGSIGSATSGDVHIEANSLHIRDNGLIQSVTQGFTADGADIFLHVMKDVEIVNGGLVGTFGTVFGQAGKIDVMIEQGNLSLGNFGGIFTQVFGPGNGGDVNVTLDHGNLSVDGNGRITSQTSGGGGDAGNINIVVKEGDASIDQEGGIFSILVGDGADGNINLSAHNLELNNEGFISVQTNSPKKAGSIILDLTGNLNLENHSHIDVTARGIADAAELTIMVDEDVSIMGGSIISTQTTSNGKGGTLSIMAENVFVANGVFITAESTSTGNAGNINLTANDTILVDNSSVRTQAENAVGGTIKLDAGNLIHLIDSEITSRVQEGSGEAGSIDFDPDFIVIQNSTVESTAVFGNGGPISLEANSAILVDSFSRLDASSQFGGNGIIDIQAPIQNLSGTIAPLPEDTVPVTALYNARCAAGQGGHFSTFVASKADSLSPTPGQFLASPLPRLSSQANSVVDSFSPVMLTASIAPLVLGHVDEPVTACP